MSRPAPHSAHACFHTHEPPRAPPAPRVALTPARRAIFDILAAAGRPLGAYEIIDALASRAGRRPAPMSVYRALDFLLEQGLAHRLASRNAWLACGAGRHGDEPVAFLICGCCGGVAEATSESLRAGLTDLARDAGFRTQAQVVELSGLCADCAGA